MDMKTTILLYLMNISDTADNRYNEIRDFSRYHNVDEVELIEQIIAKVRRDTINEIKTDLVTLLKIKIK